MVSAEEAGATPPVDVRLLGPVQVLAHGRDVTEALTPSQLAVLSVLAGAGRPMTKLDISRTAGISRSSLDPHLTRLRQTLHLDRPLHRSRRPRAGYVSLDPHVVSSDAERLRRVVSGRPLDGDREGAWLGSVLDTQDLWRGAPFEGVELVDDPAASPSANEMAAELRSLLRRSFESAAWGSVLDGLEVSAETLRTWAVGLGDSHPCWYAAVLAAKDEVGGGPAVSVMASWRRHADLEEADGSVLFAAASELTSGAAEHPVMRVAAQAAARGELDAAVALFDRALDPLPTRPAALHAARAAAHHMRGRWKEAHADLDAAYRAALRAEGVTGQAEILLDMARLTWDQDAFESELRRRLTEVHERLDPEHHRLLRSRVGACLAGGLYQDGTVHAETIDHAREALVTVSLFDDRLEAAEVLSRARKALIDVDPPVVQLERARRIVALAGESDYHRSLGLLASIVDLLHLGGTVEARAETERYRSLADRTSSAFHRYHLAALDAMWALHDGRWADARSATGAAARIGGSFGGATVRRVVQGQQLWLAIERGDRQELRVLLQVLPADDPVSPWTSVATWIRAMTGQADAAAEALRAAARGTDGFSAVPRGPLRIATLSLLAVACAELTRQGFDVAPAARHLQRHLQDHAAAGALIGWPVIYLGPTARLAGLAASAAGDEDAAAALLDQGRAEARAQGSIHGRVHRLSEQ